MPQMCSTHSPAELGGSLWSCLLPCGLHAVRVLLTWHCHTGLLVICESFIGSMQQSLQGSRVVADRQGAVCNHLLPRLPTAVRHRCQSKRFQRLNRTAIRAAADLEHLKSKHGAAPPPDQGHMQWGMRGQPEWLFCPADIPGFVEVCPGQGGLPKVVLKHSCGSKAEVWHSSSRDAFHDPPVKEHWPPLVTDMHQTKLHMHLLESSLLASVGVPVWRLRGVLDAAFRR